MGHAHLLIGDVIKVWAWEGVQPLEAIKIACDARLLLLVTYSLHDEATELGSVGAHHVEATHAAAGNGQVARLLCLVVPVTGMHAIAS